MNFSPYQSRGQLEAPYQHYTKPANLQVDNSGQKMLARANAETAKVIVEGFNNWREQYDQGKVMEANNEYNRLMSEGTAELMQKKQENALNVVEDYDKLHVKALEKVRKKYGQFINYGKAGQAFTIYTERDNNTRREHMMKYQMAETDAYHETQFNNQLATCLQMVGDGGYSDQSIAEGMNRAEPFIRSRFAQYGEEKIQEQMRAVKGSIAASALQFAINTGDYVRMGEISNKYHDVLDPKTRVSVLSSLGKRQKEAHELGQANAAIAALGLDASRDAYKQWVINNRGNADALQGLFSQMQNLCGVTMDNGRNGCVEYCMKALAGFTQFGTNNAEQRNVGNLCRAAQAENSGANLMRYNGQTLRAGDIIVYATPGDDISDFDNLEHVTISDGNGGYYGNSSSAKDYEDENGNYVRGDGCGVHSDEQDIGGYEIAYVIRPDDIAAKELTELEIEEETDKLYAQVEKQRRQQTAQENFLIRQAKDEMQDLMNQGVTDIEQYQAIANKYSYMNGVVNDHVRIALESVVAAEENRQQKAIERAAKQQASEIMDDGFEEFLVHEISVGNIKSATRIKEICNEMGITDPKQQSRCTKLWDDYLDNNGLFKITKDEFRAIEAYIPELEGMKGQAKAQMVSTIHTLAYQNAKKYMAEHDGKMPEEIELADMVSKDFKEKVATGGRTMRDSFLGSWFSTSIDISRADLAANGYMSAKYLDDGRYMLMKLNGVDRDYKTEEEVLAMIGSAGYGNR